MGGNLQIWSFLVAGWRSLHVEQKYFSSSLSCSSLVKASRQCVNPIGSECFCRVAATLSCSKYTYKESNTFLLKTIKYKNLWAAANLFFGILVAQVKRRWIPIHSQVSGRIVELQVRALDSTPPAEPVPGAPRALHASRRHSFQHKRKLVSQAIITVNTNN